MRSKDIKALEYLSYEERQRKLRLYSLERALGVLINVYKSLIGRNEEGDRFFSIVPR